MKSTAVAPSNIAFIKYWGKKDEILRLPENASVSMNLSNLLTTTTVDFNEHYSEDSILINGVQVLYEEKRVVQHLDRIRKLAGSSLKAKVVSVNNFPASTGLSSSASGFAALSVAAAHAAELHLSEKELSILARQGSGSACRSIPSGFTEWLDGNTSEESYAIQLYPPDYWAIADVVAIVNTGKKDIPTSTGMKSAQKSPFFQVRKAHMKDKLEQIKIYMKEKDFIRFGELVESEALEMHAVMLTSTPALIYWQPGTVQLMRYVHKWRAEGLPVYFTMNTGQDMHLLVESKDSERLITLLKALNEVRDVIVNTPSEGARTIEHHLF